MARKRGNNEGSVYQRSDGLWVAAITTLTGKRVAYAKTRALAAQKLQQLQQQAGAGTLTTGSSVTVEKILTEYLEHKRPSWRPRTYESAEAAVRLHLVPRLGSIKLSELTPYRIEQALRAHGQTRTAAKARQHLRAACALAIRWGWLATNPVDATDAPRVTLRKPPELSVELAGQILAAVHVSDCYPLVCVLLGCGLRLGEALGLRWADWDKDAQTLAITGQLQYQGGERVRVETKTAKGKRVVALSSWVQAALEELRAEAGDVGEESLLFDRWSRRWWQRRIGEKLSAAGIEGVRLHDLRHAYASLLLDANVPIVQVSAALGHSKPSVTMSIYAHKLGSVDRRTAEALEGLGKREG